MKVLSTNRLPRQISSFVPLQASQFVHAPPIERCQLSEGSSRSFGFLDFTVVGYNIFSRVPAEQPTAVKMSAATTAEALNESPVPTQTATGKQTVDPYNVQGVSHETHSGIMAN